MDLTNVVCVEAEQRLFPMKKPPKEDKNLVSAASNGGFPRYFKCKVFAIFLSIREKGSFRSVLFHQACLASEIRDSRGLGKSKCHFDKANTCFSNFFFKTPIR